MTVKVEGLAPLLKAMRDTKKETPKEVSKYHKQVAQLVQRDAQARANARPRGAHTGHTAKGVKASGTQKSAAVRVVIPDAYVQEFGGSVPLFGNRGRKVLVRPRKRNGYFLFPAFAENNDRIRRFYLRGLEEAIARYWAK